MTAGLKLIEAGLNLMTIWKSRIWSRTETSPSSVTRFLRPRRSRCSRSLRQRRRNRIAFRARNRQRRLYTNGGDGAYWSHVAFQHPASFNTLAMDPATKREIVEDLEAFGGAEEFYSRTGRAWKRGYPKSDSILIKVFERWLFYQTNETMAILQKQ